MLDQSCSDGCAILGYGMLLGLKSGWRRSLHWLSQMSQQRLPSNLVCWSSATWPNKKGRIEKMIMEFMKHVWTVWLFEWEGMFIWFIYLIIWVIIWNMQFKAWNWSYAAMLMPSFGVMDHQPSWMTQATTACKESWSVAMHLFEAARKGVMAKMSEILGYGWGYIGMTWGPLNYTYCNALVRLWSVQIFQDPFLAEVIAIGQQACVWMWSASVVALLSVQRGKRHFACWAKCQDCNCNPMLLSFN